MEAKFEDGPIQAIKLARKYFLILKARVSAECVRTMLLLLIYMQALLGMTFIVASGIAEQHSSSTGAGSPRPKVEKVRRRRDNFAGALTVRS